jgi:hypothetical protein
MTSRLSFVAGILLALGSFSVTFAQTNADGTSNRSAGGTMANSAGGAYGSSVGGNMPSASPSMSHQPNQMKRKKATATDSLHAMGSTSGAVGQQPHGEGNISGTNGTQSGAGTANSSGTPGSVNGGGAGGAFGSGK